MPMDKRYQVFISSTRQDLEDERRTLADMLLRNRYIPIGMEQFTASPEQAWPVIQRYIDECDYYIVIVAGMYGSTRPDHTSYTEAEYDYAVETGKPVLAFLRTDIGNLEAKNVEMDTRKRRRLAAFRHKIEQVTLRDEWNDKFELAFKVGAALDNVVKRQPAVGWIRGDEIPDHALELIRSVAEPCSRLGISRVSEDGVAGETMKQELAAARSIKIFSTSAFRLLDTYRGAITEALGHGCQIQVLVPKAGSQFLQDVEESEAVHVSRGLSLDVEIDLVGTRLMEALSRAAQSSRRQSANLGTVEIGYFTTQLRSTVVLCGNSWGWLTVTLPPFRATETMSLELSPNLGRSLLQTCSAHFDRTWDIVKSRGDVTSLEPTG